MKMKNHLLASICFCFISIQITSAQNQIAVQHGSNTTLFTDLNTAVTNAVNGDTVYLPGYMGSFDSLKINKSIHIIGVGHHPDSSLATGTTHLTGDIYLLTGADGGSITGIALNGKIYVGTNNVNQNVNNFTIERCNFKNLTFNYYTPTTFNASTNFLVKENVINGSASPVVNSIEGGQSQNNFYENNIIGYYIWALGSNNVIRNNIVMNTNNFYSISSNNCLIENNVFLKNSSSVFSGGGNIFNHNLFVYSVTIPSGTNTGTGNFVSQPLTTIFINQSGNVFNYAHNYHIQSTSPGHNGGTDGADVGIYGGTFPWKEGSIPFNPHIQVQSIPSTTDQNGNLNVNIKVAAQGN